MALTKVNNQFPFWFFTSQTLGNGNLNGRWFTLVATRKDTRLKNIATVSSYKEASAGYTSAPSSLTM